MEHYILLNRIYLTLLRFTYPYLLDPIVFDLLSLTTTFHLPTWPYYLSPTRISLNPIYPSHYHSLTFTLTAPFTYSPRLNPIPANPVIFTNPQLNSTPLMPTYWHVLTYFYLTLNPFTYSAFDFLVSGYALTVTRFRVNRSGVRCIVNYVLELGYLVRLVPN
jgi:hypothetical protein